MITVLLFSLISVSSYRSTLFFILYSLSLLMIYLRMACYLSTWVWRVPMESEAFLN